MQPHGLTATVMESRLNTESKVCPVPGVAGFRGHPGFFHPMHTPVCGWDLGTVPVVSTKDMNGKASVAMTTQGSERCKIFSGRGLGYLGS